MKLHYSTLLVLASLVLIQPASGSDRRFAYTYSSLTSPAGELELENTFTWKSRPGVLRSLDFRHELEFGLTDKTQVSLYLANWQYDSFNRQSRYQNSGVELIHNFTNPVTSLLGSAVYAELTVGDRNASLETKLLLEKRFGPWTLAWNGGVEASWEGDRIGDLQTASGELSHSIGASYDLTKKLSIGAEILHELPLDRWHGPANQELYIGPNVTFRTKGFYTTITTLFQTTDRAAEPNLQIRAIVGLEF